MNPVLQFLEGHARFPSRAHGVCVLFQEKTAELQKTRIKGKIATEIVPEEKWFTAEEYHQVPHHILAHSCYYVSCLLLHSCCVWELRMAMCHSLETARELELRCICAVQTGLACYACRS